MAKKLRKAFYKTLSWKIISTSVLFILILLLGGAWDLGAKVTILNFVITTVLYYFHELHWQGRKF